MDDLGLRQSVRAGANIDGVVDRLDDVILVARRDRSALGYFAALYRAVTLRVRDGIAAGLYDDGSRMERLVTVFAYRYLDALGRFRHRESPGPSWRIAFEAASRWRPVVLQHLLLGINAHINVDLGVACALTSPGAEVAALRPDFDAINDLLAEMTDEVQDRLGRIWPPFVWLDRIAARTDEEAFHFSLRKARAAAWDAAERLAPLDEDAMDDAVERLDAQVAVLAHLILHPGLKISAAKLVMRLGEPRNVGTIIDLLA
jgi:Family of unknown function (DUF5995)